MTPTDLTRLIADTVGNGWAADNLRRAANYADATPNPASTLITELNRMAEIANVVRPEDRSPASKLPPKPTDEQRAQAARTIEQTRSNLDEARNRRR